MLFIQLIAPIAPHLAEELWQRLGEKKSVFLSSWPLYLESLTVYKIVNLVVQVTGKVRATLQVDANISEEDAKTQARAHPNVLRHLEGKTVKKEIFIPGKLLNIVTEM